MHYLIMLALGILLLPSQAGAAAAVPSSRYTDFQHDCKTPRWVEEQRIRWKKAHPGQESSEPEPETMECKAVGHWRAQIDWSAFAEHISVRPVTRDTPESADLLGSRLSDSASHPQLEWRVINDEPFAVIYRAQEYAENPAWLKHKDSAKQFIITREYLIIRGLGAYAGQEEKLPAHTPNANQKARQLADALLQQTKNSSQPKATPH